MKAPLNAKDLKWGPAPNVFPKGAQMAIVSGDPFKDWALCSEAQGSQGLQSLLPITDVKHCRPGP